MCTEPSPAINSVYPWGRSLDEYRRMFALTDTDLGRRVVGCGDGPASFNGEMHEQGRRVVSFDPLYQFSAEEIRSRIEITYPRLVAWALQNRHLFVWDTMGTPGQMGRIRMAAMERFLADYEAGKAQGRYVVASLPDLPVADRQFDLALCSHFLFLYGEHFSLEFPLKAILEMIRVASATAYLAICADGSDGAVPLADTQSPLAAGATPMARRPSGFLAKR